MVPERLRDCHVTALSNAEGSAAALGALADLLEREEGGAAAGAREGGGGGGGRFVMSTEIMADLVGRINGIIGTPPQHTAA